MKKFLLIIYVGIGLSMLSIHVHAQTSKANNRSSLSVLNGAWVSVPSANSGDQSMEYSLYHDGYFTNIIRDSSGAWKDIYSGTYEIDGNLYKQKLLYCSISERIGVAHWMEFRIKADTLYLTFFKKLVDQTGRDITSEYEPVVNSYVRVKK